MLGDLLEAANKWGKPGCHRSVGPGIVLTQAGDTVETPGRTVQLAPLDGMGRRPECWATADHNPLGMPVAHMSCTLDSQC
jgi:hypothetical protein